MSKGKIYVQEYEANSSEIRKQYEKNLIGDNKHQNTNKTPKKKKRKK
jgi:hypothetical protein